MTKVGGGRCRGESMNVNAMVMPPVEARAPFEARHWLLLSALLLALALYAAFKLATPMQHDVAWLIDAGSRWHGGERLYIDIEDINPPLVFYVYGLLSAGFWTKNAFVIGVLLFMAANALWCWRLAGARWGGAALAIGMAVGAAEFGQRDHLAALVLPVYLLAHRAGTRERALIGAWSFIGFGLKPHFMLIVCAVTIARVLREGSWRPIVRPENVAIGAIGAAYVAFSLTAHPEFFRDMVPLVQLLPYNASANILDHRPDLIVMGLLLLVAAVQLKDRAAWPAIGALVGALACYFVQANYWTYHLVPAMSAGLFLAVRLAGPNPVRLTVVLAAMLVLATQLWGQRYRTIDPIPPDARAVLFLSSQVTGAYPWVVEHGVQHASPYASLGALAGAQAIIDDPRETAARKIAGRRFLHDSRQKILARIDRQCPDPIFVDARRKKKHFRRPFDYLRFLDPDGSLPGYREAGTRGIYKVFRRVAPCVERHGQ